MAASDDIKAMLETLIDLQKQTLESNAQLVESIMGLRGVGLRSGSSAKRKARLAKLTCYRVIAKDGWQPSMKAPIYGPGEIAAFHAHIPFVQQALQRRLIVPVTPVSA